MKNAQAQNVVKWAFGLLKMRWTILRPLILLSETQCHIMLACCLLHNFIRWEMSIDPIEERLTNEVVDNYFDDGDIRYIDTIKTSDQWTEWWDAIAQQMNNDLLLQVFFEYWVKCMVLDNVTW